MAQPEQRTLMVVHAHPDDECISTGGILARYSAEGVRTVLVTCTDGAVGEIASPDLATPETLAEVRAAELAESVRILGIAQSHRLGYRDSGMAGTPSNDHPASFHRADLDAATERLVRLLRAERPRVLVTYDENGGYGHPDHVKAHRVAVAAFHAAGDPARYLDAGEPWAASKLYFTAFPLSEVRRFAAALREADVEGPWSAPAGADAGEQAARFGTPDELVTTAVDVAAYADQKRAALLAHRTQLGTMPFFVKLPPETMRQLWTHEYFQCVEGPLSVAPGVRESDLFQGLD